MAAFTKRLTNRYNDLEFTKRLTDRYDDLERFFETPPEHVIGRLAKYVTKSDKTYLSVEQAFRRFLAERSLALEVSRKCPYRLRCMLEEETLAIPKMDKPTQSLIRVLVPPELPKPQRKTITDAIVQGHKYLVIERSFSPQLPGLSAILALTDRNATRIKLADLIEVVNSPQLSHLKELAAYTSSWIGQAEEIYDSKSTIINGETQLTLVGDQLIVDTRISNILSCSGNIGVHWEEWRMRSKPTGNTFSHPRSCDLNRRSGDTTATEDRSGARTLDEYAALGASVDRLQEFLGVKLSRGVKTSHKRHAERRNHQWHITGAVCLQFAAEQYHDFRVEVWLNRALEKAIQRAITGTREDLKYILGDYLFHAVNSSRLMQEEGGMGSLSVLGVSNENSDVKLEVTIDFVSGMNMYDKLFPAV
jgi:hypothetical protein